jgi:hypothetical protein
VEGCVTPETGALLGVVLALLVAGCGGGKLGILERFGVGTHGSGGPGQAKVHGYPVIAWDQVVRVGSEIVVGA